MISLKNIWEVIQIREYNIKLPTLDDIKEFVDISNTFSDINIDYCVGRYIVDGKSIMGILSCFQKTAILRAFSGVENSLNSYERRISKWFVGVQ
jgi:hypothetical protein